MAHINEHYQKLQAGYLFPEIGRRVRAFSEDGHGADFAVEAFSMSSSRLRAPG